MNNNTKAVNFGYKKQSQLSAKKKLKWIDCIKAIAIIAVIVDHTNALIFLDRNVTLSSYFSVTLFILISGYSTHLSAKTKSTSDIDISFKGTIAKLLPLLSQYFIAIFIIQVYNDKFFNLTTYIHNILNFNLSLPSYLTFNYYFSPYYFILFFLQLKLVTPLLLKLTKSINKFKSHILIDILILFSLFYIAYLCINYTFILPVHGGGAYLLGGTYLPVYYIGILLNKYDVLERLSNKIKAILILPLAVLWVTWIFLMANAKLTIDLILQPYFGVGFNPPSAHLIIYALITLFLFYCIFSLMEQSKNKIALFATNYVCYVGKNSLYVFLYHALVLAIFNKHLYFTLESPSLAKLILIPSMILLPCFAVSFVKALKTKLITLLS